MPFVQELTAGKVKPEGAAVISFTLMFRCTLMPEQQVSLFISLFSVRLGRLEKAFVQMYWDRGTARDNA